MYKKNCCCEFSQSVRRKMSLNIERHILAFERRTYFAEYRYLLDEKYTLNIN